MKLVKISGLAATTMALIALGATASASAFTNFNGEKAPLRFEGTQTETVKFNTSAGTLECVSGAFNGEEVSVTTATIEASFEYSGCKFLGFVFPIQSNGCKYLFHASGTVDIVNCPPGKKFTISLPGTCTVTIGEQTGLTSVGYENVGSGKVRTVNAMPAITNLVYSTTTPCAGGAHINETGGEITKGKTSFKGFRGTTLTQQPIFLN